MNENTDDPSRIASERVHSTCSVIAVAPETANAAITARRARAVTSGGGGSAVVSRWRRDGRLVQPFLGGHVGDVLVGVGQTAARDTIAAASVRLKDAAVTLVQVTPMSGRNTKPAKYAPATAPKRLIA